jgi:hypothetical protein
MQLSYRKKRNKNTGKNKIVPMKIRKFAIDIYICVFCIGIYNLHPIAVYMKLIIIIKKKFLNFSIHFCNLKRKHPSCCVLLISTTFNNISAISWRSVLLVEEARVPGENPQHHASH